MVIPIEQGEKYVSLDLVDASGESVWASVYVYGYTDGTDAHEHICGKTDAPLALGAGVEELVIVVTQTTAGATNPCAGAATQGTITGILSNRL